MTFLEKFKQDHPTANLLKNNGIPSCCPDHLGYENQRYCHNKFINCYTCWGREIPSPKTMQEKFFEMFPNAPKDKDGTPRICPGEIGWGAIYTDSACTGNCLECWGAEAKDDG